MLPISHRLLTATLCTVSTILWAVTVGAAARLHPSIPAVAPSARTPLQVALLLDSMVQPRFRRNAGQFSVDRVIVGGHDDVYDLAAHSGTERRALRRVEESRRPFVIAFLHCRHKPGANVGSTKPQEAGQSFSPYLSSLAAGTKTETGADQLREWADTKLEKAVLPSAPQLRQGKMGQADFGNWLVVMRPVVASRVSCLGCHTGARRGDTLGVMVYAVDKNRNSGPIVHLSAGEL